MTNIELMNLFRLFAIRGNKIDLIFNYNSKVLQYLKNIGFEELGKINPRTGI